MRFAIKKGLFTRATDAARFLVSHFESKLGTPNFFTASHLDIKVLKRKVEF